MILLVLPSAYEDRSSSAAGEKLASSRSANMSEEVKTLTISVKVPAGDPIKLKVKKVTPQISLKLILLQFVNMWQAFLNFTLHFSQDTKMEKIFVAIASQLGVDKANLRFTFDGKRVQAG